MNEETKFNNNSRSAAVIWFTSAKGYRETKEATKLPRWFPFVLQT